MGFGTGTSCELWRRFRRLFVRERELVFRDEALGPFVWNEDVDAWEARATASWRDFRLTVGGKSAPDPAAIAGAREVHDTREALDAAVRDLIERFAEEWPAARDEVRALRIDAVFLRAPGQGIIYLAMPTDDGLSEDGRAWRCSYVDGQPRSMAFDS